MFLRKSSSSQLNVFTPVNDLSVLSKTGLEGRAMLPGQKNDVAIAGGQILGDEYSDHVIKVIHLPDFSRVLIRADGSFVVFRSIGVGLSCGRGSTYFLFVHTHI